MIFDVVLRVEIRERCYCAVLKFYSIFFVRVEKFIEGKGKVIFLRFS